MVFSWSDNKATLARAMVSKLRESEGYSRVVTLVMQKYTATFVPAPIIALASGATPTHSHASPRNIHPQAETGEDFQFWLALPPELEHDPAWAFPYCGKVVVSGEAITHELPVFEGSNHNLTFIATTDACLLFRCARKHEHALVLGSQAVHNTAAAEGASPTFMRWVGSSMLPVGCSTQCASQPLSDRAHM